MMGGAPEAAVTKLLRETTQMQKKVYFCLIGLESSAHSLLVPLLQACGKAENIMV